MSFCAKPYVLSTAVAFPRLPFSNTAFKYKMPCYLCTHFLRTMVRGLAYQCLPTSVWKDATAGPLQTTATPGLLRMNFTTTCVRPCSIA